jgi:AcrR family transcriptional regulator
MSAEAGRRILDSAIDLLAERGFDGMSVEAIAMHAGVGKATVYRRWASKEQIVVAAIERFVHDIQLLDTGSLRSDLVGLLSDAGRAYLSPQGRLLPALASAMDRHPTLAQTVRTSFLEPRRKAVLKVLERARERGEIGTGADLDFIHDLLVGPFVYRRLFTGGPIDEILTGQLLDVAIRAFRSSANGSVQEGVESD